VSNNTIPKFYGGLTNSISIKEFTLDFVFQFSKQKGRNPYREFLAAGSIIRNVPVEFDNRWKNPGDNSTIQKVYLQSPREYTLARSYLLASDFLYTDASFIRLKTISLSYSLAEKTAKRLKIGDLRAFIQAQNLLTLTKYKGLDPETQSLSNLPQLRSIALGFQITL